jgi:pyruvate dehydrogenase E1 component alpha subunit
LGAPEESRMLETSSASRATTSVERAELAALDRDVLRFALQKMHLIRKFEETAEASYMRGLIHGTMHLSIGQEASAVGSILPLRKEDYILSTHRGHGHCIAKGADPALMFAEFFGKENGYCQGEAARCTSPTSRAATSVRTASLPAGCRLPSAWA